MPTYCSVLLDGGSDLGRAKEMLMNVFLKFCFAERRYLGRVVHADG